MENSIQSGFGRKIRRIIRYIKTNKWRVTFITILSLFFVGVLLYLFNYYRIFTLNHFNNNQKSEIVVLEQEIKTYTSNSDYKKYVYATYIENKFQTIYWYDTIKSLIGIFDNLRNMNNGNTKLLLSDFKIDMNTVKIKGKIDNMKGVYQTGGILDKFTEFDFIETISIPSYTKGIDGYEFILDANIKLNDTNTITGSNSIK